VPLDSTRTYRVAIIGAGPGGICAAVRLRQAGIEDFVVLEQAEGIGGTWSRNRYPGLACDVASHFYSFSFAPKPDWSRPFAGQAEILAYLEEVVAAFGIRPHVHLGTSVEAAHWDSETAHWRLTTGHGSTVTAETVVAGPGMFGELRYPDIEGMDRFSGASFHTGSWPAEHSLSGERVAIVGSAASAVQLLPEAANVARRVHLFQRSANRVLPKEDTPFTGEQLAHFRQSPASVAELRPPTTSSSSSTSSTSTSGRGAAPPTTASPSGRIVTQWPHSTAPVPRADRLRPTARRLRDPCALPRLTPRSTTTNSSRPGSEQLHHRE